MTNSRVLTAFCCACLAGGIPTASRAAAESPFRDRPASPRSLPADNVPPFGVLDDEGNLIALPTAPPSGRHAAGTEPESTAPGPSLSLAVEAARAAVDACAAAGFHVGAAVVDSVGEARALLTADGSDGSHVFIAMRKALTALRFEMPSSRVSQLAPSDPELLARVTPNMFVSGGALPITLKGETIGAIGVSGAGRTSGSAEPMGHQDELCAAAGLRKISKQLK